MSSLHHRIPFAQRYEHRVLAALAMDGDGRAVVDSLVDDGLQIVARFGVTDDVHRDNLVSILSNVKAHRGLHGFGKLVSVAYK